MSSIRRRDISPPRGGGGSGSNGGGIGGSSKLRMDREPVVARISDPSLIIGKRKEIDNVMKKARAFSQNEFWDKKLLDIEEKDPNRWRHTGYKKLYIEGDSSSDSEKERFRYSNTRKSRSRSPQTRSRRSPPNSPMRRVSPRSPEIRRRSPKSPDVRRPRSPPLNMRRRSPPDPRRRPKSPMEPVMRRKSPRSPRSPVEMRRRTPPSQNKRRSPPPPVGVPKHRSQVLPRSKRPPSPPPQKVRHIPTKSTGVRTAVNPFKNRTPSNSSLSSCSDDSCSVCSPKHRRARSRSRSLSMPRSRPVPRSPPLTSKSASIGGGHHNRVPPQHYPSQYSGSHAKKSGPPQHHAPPPHAVPSSSSSTGRMRPASPPVMRESVKHLKEKVPEKIPSHRGIASRPVVVTEEPVPHKRHQTIKNRQIEDPRLKGRPPPEPPTQAPAPVAIPPKKAKTKSTDKLRAKVKIEGEKRRRRSSSSGSEDSSSSESSLPTFTATTRLTLSERFGKMAQWSIDRSNMENMRITKDSAGGALKVMIEEGLESPPRRYSYSPAPAGHFPEELALTAPSGLMSWDDVRVRYEYYKNRGYLRDLDLQDYIKWEEWWYKYQEWLKQERYYEFWDRQHMNRRRRKKIPIAQRLN